MFDVRDPPGFDHRRNLPGDEQAIRFERFVDGRLRRRFRLRRQFRFLFLRFRFLLRSGLGLDLLLFRLSVVRLGGFGVIVVVQSAFKTLRRALLFFLLVCLLFFLLFLGFLLSLFLRLLGVGL